MQNHLHRNPDGSLRAYGLDELPSQLKEDYGFLPRHKFFVGSIEDNGLWVLPISVEALNDIPAIALESYVSQHFEASF